MGFEPAISRLGRALGARSLGAVRRLAVSRALQLLDTTDCWLLEERLAQLEVRTAVAGKMSGGCTPRVVWFPCGVLQKDMQAKNGKAKLVWWFPCGFLKGKQRGEPSKRRQRFNRCGCELLGGEPCGGHHLGIRVQQPVVRCQVSTPKDHSHVKKQPHPGSRTTKRRVFKH